MTKMEAFDILETYQLNGEAITKCVEAVAKTNKRIDIAYKEAKNKWQGLSVFMIKDIIDIYNKSDINIKTGQIVCLHSLYPERTLSCRETYTIKMETIYKTGKKEYIDLDLYALVGNGGSSIESVYYMHKTMPGLLLHDHRKRIMEIKPMEHIKDTIELNLSDIPSDVTKITVFAYRDKISKINKIFSSVTFSILNHKGYEVVGMDITEKVNSSYGGVAFELIRRVDSLGETIWDIQIANEDINIGLSSLICTC